MKVEKSVIKPILSKIDWFYFGSIVWKKSEKTTVQGCWKFREKGNKKPKKELKYCQKDKTCFTKQDGYLLCK